MLQDLVHALVASRTYAWVFEHVAGAVARLAVATQCLALVLAVHMERASVATPAFGASSR